MNAWLIAVVVLLVAALAPCLAVTSFGSVSRRLVGLSVANTVTVAILLLSAEGLRRTSYVDLALVLVLLGPVGTLVFTRFLGPDERSAGADAAGGPAPDPGTGSADAGVR